MGGAPAPSSGQAPDRDASGSDEALAEATLRLIRRAQAARAAAPYGVAYQARAEGHVYFYLDRDDGGAPVPLRVDQVVLDLYRSESGRTRQIMRGARRREFLPVRDFGYYIDRLTVVQNGFGDRITVGEGRDVRDVPHPLGTGADDVYRYQIVDSLRLGGPALPAPVLVYEVEVRPLREDRPGFAGSLFLEARAGGLVRMDFTFTPASYVDPRSDRIAVRLEHGLWEEQFWLPYRQTVEVRREAPEVDLPVGTVIRAKLEVTDYDFDVAFAPEFFRAPAVVRVPYGTADSSIFRVGLAERLADEGLSPVSMASLESEVRSAVRERAVSALPPLRLYADGVSSVVRANRAEGVHFGAGASFFPRAALRFEAMAGYATAAGKPSGTFRARWSAGGGRIEAKAEVFGRELRDTGPVSAASGAVNTVSTLLWEQDYTDPFFASGTRLSLRRQGSGGNAGWLGAFAERHAGATESWFDGRAPSYAGKRGDAGNTEAGHPRPLRPVREGLFAGIVAEYAHRWAGTGAWGAQAGARATAGRWDGAGVATLALRLEARAAAPDLSRRAALTVDAGRAWGPVPSQMLFYLGGRGSLPGHGFRQYGGKGFVLLRSETAATVVPGWLGFRLLAGAGGVERMSPEDAGAPWADGSGGLRGYVGAGLATLHDTIRLDGAWGVRGGTFEVVLSLDPWLWPYL